MKFSSKDLVTFTEEILNGKLHFLRSVMSILITHEHMSHILESYLIFWGRNILVGKIAANMLRHEKLADLFFID